MKNQFRAAILGGQAGKAEPLMAEKQGQDSRANDATSINIPRWEERHADHRDADRHRLTGELAHVRHRGRDHAVGLVNLSGGGAMIDADGFSPHLHDHLDLVLGENGTVECAVRWIRDGRIGLEFAHETRLDCSADERAALLAAVVARHFDGQSVDLAAPAPVTRADLGVPAPSPDEDGDSQRREGRHPLIWHAELLFDHDRHPVRLRNVSANGAMAEGDGPYMAEDLVYLDLGPAGERLATVTWRRGDQVGLKFVEPIDIADLASCRTETVALQWKKPGFLETHDSARDPWDGEWKRMTLDEIQRSLEGFLKH